MEKEVTTLDFTSQGTNTLLMYFTTRKIRLVLMPVEHYEQGLAYSCIFGME